jgi:hypothetical protein
MRRDSFFAYLKATAIALTVIFGGSGLIMLAVRHPLVTVVLLGTYVFAAFVWAIRQYLPGE